MTGILRHPRGPRVYVLGVRVHHGSAGLAAVAIAAAIGSRELALVGLVAVAHDWRDCPWRDCDNH